ncbi:MAG: glycine zipper 2TM domain-containing protein [Alphaproteobacteria bacterium]|nr:MAG: glycine zipper 2TM domain-containing protein [Alphaproteobacteria bacterium]
MKKTNMLVAALVAAGLGLSGCADMQSNPKTTGGTLLGGVGGALLGSMIGGGTGKLVAVGVGTLAGAMIGREVGKSLDAADRAQIDRAEKQATTAPLGQTITWNNPQSGNNGAITPVRDGNDQDGRYCREFQQTIEVGGKLEKGYGTACRQADGSWQIMN